MPTPPNESVPAEGEIRPTIETISQAAAEIARLHTALGKVAVDLTPEYIKQRLAGEEGTTWAMFPRIGFLRRPTPILDPVVRQDGVLLLDAGYTMWSYLLNEYTMSKSAILVPGDANTFAKVDTVTIHRSGRGFDPGDEYVAGGGKVLKAGHKHQGSIPTIGSDGNLAWSASRDMISGVFRDMDEVDGGLRDVIEKLRAYEPPVVG
ncbi:MAG TPA: hypothetical protein VLE73_04085 [Candidatus Saccharimonadales bacterium]|nr:hypothetical protein [Candidatus Saccharimonadales bacterium]